MIRCVDSERALAVRGGRSDGIARLAANLCAARALRLRRGAAAAVMLLELAACSPSTNRIVPSFGARAMSDVARVVPQLAVDLHGYRLLAAGGRFAFFDDLVLDLANSKVAWVGTHRPLPVRTRPDHAVVQRDQGAGVRVWDLRTGASQEFAGVRLQHAVLPEHMIALVRGETVVLVDALAARELLQLRVRASPISVLCTDDQILHVLQRPRDAGAAEAGGQRTLIWQSFALADGSLRADRTLEFGLLALQPPPHASGASPWFLWRAPDGGLRAAVIARSGSRDPTVMLYSHALSDPAPTVVRFEAIPLDRSAPVRVLPAEGPHVRAPAPPAPPAEVATALARMAAAEPTATSSLSPDGNRFVSVAAQRTCIWSLARAERTRCVPEARLTEPLDRDRVWVIKPDGADTLLGVWSLADDQLQWRRVSGALVVAPSGERYLLARKDAAGVKVEAWTWGRAQSDWQAVCGSTPSWTPDGGQVACPADAPSRPIARLDARSGVSIGDIDAAQLSSLPAPAPACGLTLDVPPALGGFFQRGGDVLQKDDRAVAGIYDLGPDAWAIVLPDGRFKGSARVAEFLAFYDAKGEPLDAAAIAALHRPAAVDAAITAARACR